MSPAAGLEPVRVGPEEIRAGDVAAKLVGKLGVHHVATDLIENNAKAHPLDLTILQQTPQDRGRAATLDFDEVEEKLADQIGEESILVIHGARVHGANGPDAALQVVVLFERPTGRTARAALMYSDLPKSGKAYEKAVKNGSVVGLVHDIAKAEDFEAPAALSDAEKAKAESLKADSATNDELLEEIKKLKAENAKLAKSKDKTAPAASETPSDDATSFPKGLLKTVATVKKGIKGLDDAQLDAVEAAEKRGDDRTGVLKAISAERDSRKN